jgi:5-methylcytosine-specific restriction endonuclease McrBC GTP-binding regulatory subunit McrB
MDKYDKYINLLLETPNLILTGTPGTGKTYLAKEIAKKLIFPNLPDEDLKNNEKLEEKGFNEFCKFVQFHPSYDYTDFVEGLRPDIEESSSGTIGFKLKNGTFKEFCKKALETWIEGDTKKFVFIIDEINRGEISKIFGELFFSIEQSYRGKKGKVMTQYANMQKGDTIFDTDLGSGWFYIPENVYIIGTMNDIDRSVESFDFAMRRRFIWQEITAEESADNMNLPKSTKNRMNRLNEAISKIEGLSSAYHIGASYFLKDGKPVERNDNEYEDLWRLRLESLLYEYLRGTSEEEKKKKMDILKAAYKGESTRTETTEDDDESN